MSNVKNKKFVYKSEDSMKMHEFYDKTLASLGVPYLEDFFDTSFGKTHCLLVGDPEKPRICTIHGGNGITPLNLKLFLPLLQEYCIIAPDVIGMPGKGYLFSGRQSIQQGKRNLFGTDYYYRDR